MRILWFIVLVSFGGVLLGDILIAIIRHFFPGL